MRIANSNPALVSSAVCPEILPHPTDGPAFAMRQASDLSAIMGVPQAELTPRVRASIRQLMGEVQRLRGGLATASARIEYLERLADQDALVPVPNRRAFIRELTRMLAFARRYQAPGSLLYFDVNGMKDINDAHGHAAGDATLGHVARILSRNVRASDVVGRLGGDEFAVILAQADHGAATAKAAELAAAIRSRPLIWDGAELTVEVAYGLYTFSGAERPHRAIEAADRAMYAHKNAARASPPGRVAAPNALALVRR
jgi:diguanylate cyclase (GGDEF)-like protein